MVDITCPTCGRIVTADDPLHHVVNVWARALLRERTIICWESGDIVSATVIVDATLLPPQDRTGDGQPLHPRDEGTGPLPSGGVPDVSNSEAEARRRASGQL